MDFFLLKWSNSSPFWVARKARGIPVLPVSDVPDILEDQSHLRQKVRLTRRHRGWLSLSLGLASMFLGVIIYIYIYRYIA